MWLVWLLADYMAGWPGIWLFSSVLAGWLWVLVPGWFFIYGWLNDYIVSSVFLILPNFKKLAELIIYNLICLLAIEAKGGIQEEDRADNNYNKNNKNQINKN